ncbi:MAG: alpha/beta fold hydrolase [Verrucomicrobia bacterium]|nr:alpha/beta fold hydrolase [Verrucomicrobiota bacterium]
MKPSLTLITGWAHGTESLQPLAEQLSTEFDVRILTGAQVLAEKKIPDADFVIGWSMGGMLAIEYLPARCKKLVLISSTARFCAAENYPCGVPEKVLRRMIVQLKRDPGTVLAEFYKNVSHPHPPKPGSCAYEHLAEGLDYLRTADLREKVPTIGNPVLLLHGEEDLIIPPAASDWLAQHLPTARSVRLAGEGHQPDPLAIAPHIRHFLTPEKP